ncbi:esterase-like activity of phytase family protein [Streptomyces sp. SID13031]|uniref:esterase-like activity of phytase family protein n=1 Tax=Streptomyces sp. SID13031 TaxID=2706046 RepID=UPI0031BA4DC5
MQSALQQPDLGSTKAGGVSPARIVAIDLRTHESKQYLYLLDNPATTGDANSEITALSNTRFLVDERDGTFGPFAQKTLYEIDVNGAGVTVAQKQPYVNAGMLVSRLDPTGKFFSHDKVEGVATADAGRTLYLSNDNDFGIDIIVVAPDGQWTVHQKALPTTGRTDNGEILKIDTTKLPAVLKTVTVTIHVR